LFGKNDKIRVNCNKSTVKNELSSKIAIFHQITAIFHHVN